MTASYVLIGVLDVLGLRYTERVNTDKETVILLRLHIILASSVYEPLGRFASCTQAFGILGFGK
jgi:hypothetical protein